MSIVTAAVHASVRRRLVRELVVLGHRQRVHVGAQADRLAAVGALAGELGMERADVSDGVMRYVDGLVH